VEATTAVVLGRSYSYATAREGALKIMETCALPSLAYSTAEFRHGPLAAVGPGTVVLVTGDVEPAMLTACRGAGAHVILAPRSELRRELAPIADIVPFQLLAREASLAKGLDPDRPAVLMKATLTL
jgi:glucosamine--fructose-6-phosphate aminotransferase (isomerizing)